MINNGDEFYPDPEGTVVIRNLIAGKEYPIKIKFVIKGNLIEMDAPSIIVHNKTKQYSSEYMFMCESTVECFSEIYIYI